MSEIPKQLDSVQQKTCVSYFEVVGFLQANEPGTEGLLLSGSFPLDLSAVKLIPDVFSLNRHVKLLRMDGFKINDTRVARMLRELMSKDQITKIDSFDANISKSLTKAMCQGIHSRRNQLELRFSFCSPEFVNSIIEASYSRCFSLKLFFCSSHKIQRPLKKLFSRGSLNYLNFHGIPNLTCSTFLQLARCVELLPGLVSLSLTETPMPAPALARLYMALQANSDSNRPNLFEDIHLEASAEDDRLSYCFVRLLQSDATKKFSIKPKESVFPAALIQSISSTVANTSNLEVLSFGNKYFSSGTSFENFILQQANCLFRNPFGVNLKN